jgi:hypothetical protein
VVASHDLTRSRQIGLDLHILDIHADMRGALDAYFHLDKAPAIADQDAPSRPLFCVSILS